MADEPDYYAVLEGAPDADDEAIRQAFRRLARLYHPDVAATGDLTRMQRLNAAYQVLGDAARRAAYDLTRAPRHADPSHASAATQPAQTARPHRPRAGMVRATA